MKLELNDRVALVTGASRRIGLAIATSLAAEGAKVALAARGAEALNAARAAIGGSASVHVADVDRSQPLRKRWSRTSRSNGASSISWSATSAAAHPCRRARKPRPSGRG